MPDYDSGETIAFILDMPSGMIEELKQALEGLEVIFDPNQQVVAFTHGITSQTVAMGHHIPGMVLEINRSLDEAGLTPRIPEAHEKWSTLRPPGIPAVLRGELRLDRKQDQRSLVGGRGNNLAETHAGQSPDLQRTGVTQQRRGTGP